MIILSSLYESERVSLLLEKIKDIKEIYFRYMRKIVLIFSGISIFSIVSIIFLQVIMRYIFNSGLRWPNEIAGFIFVWICFIGPIFAFESNALLKLDYFREKLPGKLKIIIEFLIESIVLITLMILIYYGFKNVMNVWSRATPALRFSYGYVYLSFPIGFIILFIGYFLDFFEHLLEEFL